MRKIESGIYCYENLVNGKKYIGQSQNLYKRYLDHEQGFQRAYGKGTGRENKPLWLAIQKYGRENFRYYVIEFCDVTELDEKEIFYIQELNSHISKSGYNLSLGGNTSRGVVHSKEARKNMSKAHIGEKHTKEHNEKIGQSHVGMKYSLKNRKSSSKYVGIYQRSKTYGRSKIRHWVIDIRRGGQRFIKHWKNEMDAVEIYNQFIIENGWDEYPLS